MANSYTYKKQTTFSRISAVIERLQDNEIFRNIQRTPTPCRQELTSWNGRDTTQKSGALYSKRFRRPRIPTQTHLQGSQHSGAPQIPPKDCTPLQKANPHKDVRCLHHTMCMKDIVSNVCLHKSQLKVIVQTIFTIGQQDVWIFVSGSYATSKFARLCASMKVKPSDSVLLLTPVQTLPEEWTTSSSSLD